MNGRITFMSYSIFEETMVDMPWTKVDKIIRDGAAILLPTGVIEEHGPHMGLGVDTYLSCLACVLTRKELDARGIKTLIAPPFYWGINNATGSFPGSFTVRKDTMKALLYDILSSLKRWGASCVFNINWHEDSEHCRTLLEAIKDARVETGIRAFSIISESLANRLRLSGKENHIITYPLPQEGAPPEYPDIHAGSFETGIMAGYYPDQVDMDTAVKLQSTDITMEKFMKWRQGWSDAQKITPLGYLGNPSAFSAEAGRKSMEELCRVFADVIENHIKPT